MSDNLQPTIGAARLAILRFAQSMVNHSTLRALQLILSPCCPVISSVVVACAGTGLYKLTFQLSSPLSLIGKGEYIIFVNGTKVATGAWADNTNSLVVSGFTNTAGSKTVQLQLFLPTDTAADTGVSLNSNIITTIFPSC